MRFNRLLILILLACGLTVAARAQSVRWQQGERGLANEIILIFENCEPDGPPALPAIPGVNFAPAGRSESMNMVNFQVTRSVALSFLVRGPQNPPVQIPAFNVRTTKGTLRVEPFGVAAPAAPLESVASAKLIPARSSVWAGEVFGLNYELSASRRTNPQILPTFDWNSTPLVAEDWSKPEVSESRLNGDGRVNVIFRTRAVAKSPNTVKLEAATHLLSIQTGTIGFGIISSPRMEQVSVTSDQPVITVRPLPAGAPAGFSGAVGQFKLVSKVVPEKAAVGEPVTWTLELSGTGNWPDLDGLPARSVSNDFQVVQPKAKRTPSEGKLFDVTLAEDVVLVPSKAGSYTLGPVAFTYFDPASGGYKTLTTPRTALTISATMPPQFSAPAPSGPTPALPPPAPAETAIAPAPHRPISPAALPASIPRDPLPGQAIALAPWSTRRVGLAALLPFLGLLGFWLFLALRRARETDPVRPRREARDRLTRTLAQLATANGPDRTPLLLAWQHDSAVLWQMRHAAPSAATFQNSASPQPGTGAASDSRADEWSSLWSEADRALYGAKGSLPSDWVARAQAALAAKPIPGFRPLRLFLPQNLMPFAAVMTLAAFSSTALLQAAVSATDSATKPAVDGMAAYRKADFPSAEKAWREASTKTPTDWIARHNLSLALEQQEHAGEAAAQAAAAFVQNPAHPAVRWHFAHTAEKLGTSPAALAEFATPGPRHAFAQLASPAQWQRVLVAAAWVAALGLAGLLARAYGRGPRSLKWTSIALLTASVLGALGADVALISFGPATQEASVIVARASTLRSIPTEADTTQKSSPLAVGSLGLADKSFLGWQRLVFENGQTGWVRQEDLVPIWK